MLRDGRPARLRSDVPRLPETRRVAGNTTGAKHLRRLLVGSGFVPIPAIIAKRALTSWLGGPRGLFTGRGAAPDAADYPVANRYGQMSPGSDSGERQLSVIVCRWLFDIVIVDEGTCGRRPWVSQL